MVSTRLFSNVSDCHFANNVNFPVGKSFHFDYNFTKGRSNGPINNKPALVQIMAWRRTGDKPLSEPVMT